jgi:hypothetical protein
MANSPKRPPFQSSLEKYPEHVRAIGMISIESANLDIMFSDLLAAVLDIPEQISHAIFLTPRSATVRVEIFENVAKYAFPIYDTSKMDEEPKKLSEEVNRRQRNDRKRVEALLSRARAIANKRHQVIHEAWGLNVETLEVSRRPLPIKPGSQFTPIPIGTLTTIIRDLRFLIDEVILLRDEFVRRCFDALWARAQIPSPDKTQSPSQDKRHSQKTRPSSGQPKKKRQPRPSQA